MCPTLCPVPFSCQVKRDAGIGEGPEYDYPKIGVRSGPAPVSEELLSNEEEAKGYKPVAGETSDELSDKQIEGKKAFTSSLFSNSHKMSDKQIEGKTFRASKMHSPEQRPPSLDAKRYASWYCTGPR